MADQKRWFKVWTSINGDPHFSELPLSAIGQWALLGAYVALHGEAGRLVIPGAGTGLCQVLRVPDLHAASMTLSTLPNVVFEEGKNRDGAGVVTLKNWHKYQVDASGSQRMKALRSKRRGEEKRREKKRNPSLLPPQPGVEFRVPDSIQQALAKCPRLLQTTRVTLPTYWQALIRANPGVDYGRELLKAEAWLAANPNRPRKDLSRFVANWINRAERDGGA